MKIKLTAMEFSMKFISNVAFSLGKIWTFRWLICSYSYLFSLKNSLLVTHWASCMHFIRSFTTPFSIPQQETPLDRGMFFGNCHHFRCQVATKFVCTTDKYFWHSFGQTKLQVIPLLSPCVDGTGMPSAFLPHLVRHLSCEVSSTTAAVSHYPFTCTRWHNAHF